MVRETSKIPTIQYSKMVKVATTKVVCQAIIKVETIEEEQEDEEMTRAISNVITVKSLDTSLANVIPTRMIHKKLKQNLQGRKMMIVYYLWWLLKHKLVQEITEKIGYNRLNT